MSLKLIILRGLPSSGKSTRAKELAGSDGQIFSTDEFFYVVEESFAPNKYSFNSSRLGEAHRWNKERAMKAMDEGVEVVIIDNTNVKKSEPQPYIDYGLSKGYEVSIEEPNSPHWVEMRETLRSKDASGIKKWSMFLAKLSKETHNVPQEAIERMMNKWQEFSINDFV